MAESALPIGDAIVTRSADGTVTVQRADPLIRVSIALLDAALPAHWDFHTLTLDTAGRYRYRKVGPDPDDPLRVLLFERIEDGPVTGDYKGVPQ